MSGPAYTIGHSNHPLGEFLSLLRRHGVTAVADVRSAPYSRRHPQFKRDTLRAALDEAAIAYVFLGRELGARPADPGCYDGRKVRFDRLACSEPFGQGLARVRDGAARYRIALLCAEREPLDCHRTILVSRHLAAAGTGIRHIHADGSLEPHARAMTRLVGMLGLPDTDLFRSRAELEAEACDRQGERIGYERP